MSQNAQRDPNDPYATRIREATRTIELADGRTLAYAEFGDPDGDPVVVFHGGIGSRGFGLLLEEPAETAGVRVLSPDRPGYGRSDPKPGRTLLEWPTDVAALSDHLGIETVPVLGVSGGGPYAAACAYALPARVSTAAIASGMGPPGAPRSRGMGVVVRLARWTPWLVGVPIRRTLSRARTDPDAAVDARAAGKAAPEAAMHRGDAGRRLTAQTAEAGRQGYRHAVEEIAILGHEWGFDLADVASPVGVWHGALDGTVPVEAAPYVAERIPDARLLVHDDVGHLSLVVEYAAEILAFLRDPAAYPSA